MKRILILILFTIFNLTNYSYSQDYFPLKIGNRFVYLYEWNRYWPYGSNSGSRLQVMSVTDTTTYNGKKYFYCSGISDIVTGWVRVDTLTKSLYKYDPSNTCPFYFYETLIDSLGMINPGMENYCHPYYCYGMSADSMFLVGSYSLHYSKSEMKNEILMRETHRFYNKLFGFKKYLTSYDWGQSGGSDYYTLKGCKINGICYGDTTGITTGLNNISTEIPSKYSLLQNYPNPFNPITKIQFEVPGSKFVKLVVFDILGKEVQTLVNESLQPGTYETSFDGSSLTSGVYFYRLITNEFTETKKMLLIK